MRVWITAGAVLILSLISGILIKEPNVRESQEAYTLHLEAIQNPEKAVNAFSKSLTFPTVGKVDSPNHIGDATAFQNLHKHLEKAFPSVYKALKVAKVNEYSLLMKWTGRDASLKPMLFISHQDVVPAGSLSNWTYPPFSGTVADGYIWGRGALDTKISLVGVLEAVNQLLAVGFTPQRTIFLAFGHDEEMGGEYGAKLIAERLKTHHNVKELEIVLDEGGMIDIDGLGAKTLLHNIQVAGVGMATKGFESWKIHITGEGGHSSMPPTGQSTSTSARIAGILARFEAQQTSTKLVAPTVDLIQALAPGVKYAPVRMVFELANNRIINPILGQIIGGLGNRLLNAFVRTTAAVVEITAGGGAHNVLPLEGSIEINFRVLPGEDSSTIKQYIDQIIQNEAISGNARAEKIISGYPPSLVTPTYGPNYDLIVRAIKETFTPDPKVTKQKLLVAPLLIVGGTDALWYEDLSSGRAVFRFNPVRIESSKGDLERIHGVDERISVEVYLDAVRFYMKFIKLAAGDGGESDGGAE
jgi:carboxypeptidase PM20D1